MGRALNNSAEKAPDIHKDKIFFNLEYSDDIVCTFETYSNAQALLD